MKKLIKIIATCTLLSLTLPSCTAREDEVLLFEDFTEGEIPDPAVWRLCTYANNAWSQHFEHVEGYEQVSIRDGMLILRAEKADSVYKNAGIRTIHGFPNNSRVEVRARLNGRVRGGFPAIWQMPLDAPRWPDGGEIDIMEWIQDEPYTVWQTVHTGYLHGPVGPGGGATNEDRPSDFDVTTFHTYAADRTPEAVIFYIDGIETFRYANENLDPKLLQFPFGDYDYDIILNYSLGGLLNGELTWPGEIHDEDLPGELIVDWVKVTKLY